jgi:hypothetical protein
MNDEKINHYDRLRQLYTLLLTRNEKEEAELLRPLIAEMDEGDIMFFEYIDGELVPHESQIPYNKQTK